MSSRISFILWLRDGLFRLVRAAYFSLFSRFFRCFSCISVSILHAALALYSVLLCLEGCLNIHRIFFVFCCQDGMHLGGRLSALSLFIAEDTLIYPRRFLSDLHVCILKFNHMHLKQ